MMNTRKAQEELSKVADLDAQIHIWREELLMLESKVKDISPALWNECISGSKGSDLSKSIAELMDFREMTVNKITRLIRWRRRIVGRINALKNKDHAKLLYYYYCGRNTLAVIGSQKMYYSHIWVRKHHKAALEEYERTYFSKKRPYTKI